MDRWHSYAINRKNSDPDVFSQKNRESRRPKKAPHFYNTFIFVALNGNVLQLNRLHFRHGHET